MSESAYRHRVLGDIRTNWGISSPSTTANTSIMSPKGKEKEKPIASLIAGATAGGVEAFITYPLESLKTQLQFQADGKVSARVRAVTGRGVLPQPLACSQMKEEGRGMDADNSKRR